ncbi:hypothetical protein [Mucilaginibacter paludis]|uniref:Uncharacterized protein n=1 Tax=Mucilaginibacter paludis DSM 18603 TaxID=714943 RepID=H1Y1W8_9SPHI|nr:hypothetical protein [Mucilaginibacter paludis]EHQ25671.1 hypothetical protein Mucpa_1513 [Mucilaginibacter paludis DSM 18603]
MKALIKCNLLTILMLVLGFTSFAQLHYNIDLRVSDHKAKISSVEFACGDVGICLDPDGDISLNLPQEGGYEYFTRADGEYKQGKLKRIGNTNFDYYDVFAGEDKRGKLKSIGDVAINYYDRLDGFDNIGRAKSIGKFFLRYYDRFDGQQTLLGQLKAIGDANVSYYTQFDGFDNIGKLKSIGNTIITYYTRFDFGEDLGRIKSVTGITPHVRIRRAS